jgi:hypothetical protein
VMFYREILKRIVLIYIFSYNFHFHIKDFPLETYNFNVVSTKFSPYRRKYASEMGFCITQFPFQIRLTAVAV